MSEQSESINELAASLAIAQGKITGAMKESQNPFFKSKYADLANCWDACRAALSEAGLCVLQTIEGGEPVTVRWEITDSDTGELKQFSVESKEVVIVTTLAHSSGQWIRSRLPLVPRDVTPQGIGSAITYGRRYGLTAMVGVAQVDDDGAAASGTKYVSDTHIAVKFDPKERDKYTSRLMDAFDADIEEAEIARIVNDIHQELASKHDLYIAVGNALGAKKNAIRKYLEIFKKSQRDAA